MAAGERIDGRCLCGAARFSAELSDGFMSVCHCGMCRRWTSGVFMSLAVKPESLRLEDEAAFGLFASSAEAERGFCRTCGSPLFWRARDGSSADVSVQAVDDPSRFPFELEIYLDEKPGNYDFANRTRRLTGAQWRAAKEGANG
jgi:hypothetical protein